MTTLPGAPLPHVAVTLDGTRVGDLRALEGLKMEADIATNDLGPDNVQKKHVSTIRWTPGLLTVGLGMGLKMGGWLRDSLDGKLPQTGGSITFGDANDRAQSSVNFTGAMLTQLTVPTLDAASRDPAALIIGFQAEQVRSTKGDGSAISGIAPAPKKPWLCSGFRLEIGSLPCGHIVRIESFTWAASVAADTIGIFREPTKHPAKIVVPDLQIAIAAADYPVWAAAAQKWFIDGHHEEGDEMSGRLVLVAGDGSELASINLANVGFRSFPTLFPAGIGADRFVTTLYVEKMAFNLAA